MGAERAILPGVTVGEEVAIGANSFVNKDCEPWMIYGGSSAKPLRPRARERILELEAKLRCEVYEAEGRYLSKDKREKGKLHIEKVKP